MKFSRCNKCKLWKQWSASRMTLGGHLARESVRFLPARHASVGAEWRVGSGVTGKRRGIIPTTIQSFCCHGDRVRSAKGAGLVTREKSTSGWHESRVWLAGGAGGAAERPGPPAPSYYFLLVTHATDSASMAEYNKPNSLYISNTLITGALHTLTHILTITASEDLDTHTMDLLRWSSGVQCYLLYATLTLNLHQNDCTMLQVHQIGGNAHSRIPLVKSWCNCVLRRQYMSTHGWTFWSASTYHLAVNSPTGSGRHGWEGSEEEHICSYILWVNF